MHFPPTASVLQEQPLFAAPPGAALMCSTVIADQWKQGTSTINHTGVRLLERRHPLPVVRNHGWVLGHSSHRGQVDGTEGAEEGSCREGRVAWLKPVGLELPQCLRQLSLKP